MYRRQIHWSILERNVGAFLTCLLLLSAVLRPRRQSELASNLIVIIDDVALPRWIQSQERRVVHSRSGEIAQSAHAMAEHFMNDNRRCVKSPRIIATRVDLRYV